MRSDPTLAQRMAQLFAEEAILLRAGDYAALPAVVARKEACLIELEAGETALSAKEAKALQHAARRSERLLGAALRGARAARARHSAVMRAAAGLETYDRKGQRSLLAKSSVQLEKRA